MTELPSLAELSLKTKPTGTIQYYDPDMDETTMPNEANFNTLILQDSAYSDAFGIDFKQDRRHKLFRERRADLFGGMMNAILGSSVLVPEPGNPRLFKLDIKPKSAFAWDFLFPASAMNAGYIGAGGFNFASKVNIQTIASSGVVYAEQLVAMTGGAKHVVVRKSRGFGTDVNLKRVLTELAMQARMAELGIGPKMYMAWCVPNEAAMYGRRSELSDLVNTQAGNVILNACTVSELFDADIETILTGRGSQWVVSKDVTDASYQQLHGFWRAVGDAIVRAVKHGILHFDLKGANMLYRTVEGPTGATDYKYEVCYTDFDPKYFMILNMQRPEFTRMQLCFGLLSLYQLLASHRCFHQKLKFYDEDRKEFQFPFEAVEKIAREAFIDAYVAAHESRVTVEDIESLCGFGGPSTSHDSMVRTDLPQRLQDLLRRWFKQYLVRDPATRCIDELAPDIPFHEIADIIVKFAASGTRPPAGAKHRT